MPISVFLYQYVHCFLREVVYSLHWAHPGRMNEELLAMETAHKRRYSQIWTLEILSTVLYLVRHQSTLSFVRTDVSIRSLGKSPPPQIYKLEIKVITTVKYSINFKIVCPLFIYK